MASFDLADFETGMYHKLEIVETPIALKLTTEDVSAELETVLLSSVYGQLFSCSYKSPSAILANISVEPEKPWLHVNTSQLLGHLSSRSECFRATKGWWSYEVCPWKHVIQYHDDRETRTSSGRSLLGIFAREYNWTTSNETDDQVRKKYHSQYFENGATCDLTQQPRTAHIQYLCQRNDEVEDGIVDIQEPQTCRYVIQIHIHKLCESSVFRRSKVGYMQVGITCNPALGAEKFQAYQAKYAHDKQQEKLINQHSDLTHDSSNLHDGLYSVKDNTGSIGAQKTTKEGSTSGSTRDNNLHDGLYAAKDDTWSMDAQKTTKEGSTSGEQAKDALKDELVKAFEKLTAHGDDAFNPDPLGGKVNIEVEVVGDEFVLDGEDAFDAGFEAELAKVGNLRASDVEMLRAQLADQFDSIIDEAQAELSAEEKLNPTDAKAVFNREEAVKTLTDTLDKMMDKVQNGDPRISKDSVHIEQQSQSEVKEPALPVEPQATGKQQRVSTSSESAGAKSTEDHPVEVKYDGDPFAKESLSQAIKKELEKAGVKPGERHVEIRVITAPRGAGKKLGNPLGSPDADITGADGQPAELPENTGRVLGQMIAAVLTSDAGIVRTAYDQQMLENNYAVNYDFLDESDDTDSNENKESHSSSDS